jgi:glycosyltransferase involved in cell wall biosynthesis
MATNAEPRIALPVPGNMLPTLQPDAAPPTGADVAEVGGGVDVSVVIPLLNEKGNVEPLYEQLVAVLAATGKTFEIIFIDDGSTDGTFLALKALYARDPHVRVMRFRRNFGQTAAFSAGFDMAMGAVIVTMDGDRQNDPADIPRLLEKVDEGYDVVSGWRVHRKDGLIRRVPSQAANALISAMTGVRLHDYGCSLKAYKAEVVKNTRLYGEMHRFIPALASWMGIQVAEIPVNHYPRTWGRSKYGISRTIRVILDLITVKFFLGYGTRPIQIFGLIGIACLALGSLIGAYLTVLKVFFGASLSDRPLLLLAVLMVVLGVQLITMGLIGELVVRVYYEVQNKPIYAKRDVLDATADRAATYDEGLEVLSREAAVAGGDAPKGRKAAGEDSQG